MRKEIIAGGVLLVGGLILSSFGYTIKTAHQNELIIDELKNDIASFQNDISMIKGCIYDLANETTPDLKKLIGSKLNSENEVVAGTIVKTDKGLVLEAEDGNYIVGGQDLSDLVGKSVMLTGTFQKGDARKVLTIMSFEVISED